MTAEDSDGQPIAIQSLAPGGEVSQKLHLLFQQTQGEQAFALPTRNLTFRAVSYPALPERNIAAPVFLVEAYRGADPAPVFDELVEDTAAVKLDGVTLTLQRDRYVILEAAALPGLPLLLLGAIITLAGVITSVVCGPTRAWIGMAADGDAVDLAVRAAVAAEPERETTRLLAALRTAPAPAVSGRPPMPADALAWLAAAVILLIGALLGVFTRRDRLWLPLAALAAGLLGVLIGVGSHAWRPAEPSAEALALLAGGALVVTAWAAPRWTRPSESSANERSLALAGRAARRRGPDLGRGRAGLARRADRGRIVRPHLAVRPARRADEHRAGRLAGSLRRFCVGPVAGEPARRIPHRRDRSWAAGGALQLPVADRCAVGRRGMEPGGARDYPGTPARRSVAAGGLAARRDLPARHVDLATEARGCLAGNVAGGAGPRRRGDERDQLHEK